MHIRKIEIKNFRGTDLEWSLDPEVNVLIGTNGSGKSTLLRMINEAMLLEDQQVDFRVFDPIDNMIIDLEIDRDNSLVISVDSDSRSITGDKQNSDHRLNVTFINTFDVIFKSPDLNKTVLDQKLYDLKQEFIVYQRDLLEQVEKILTSDDDKISKRDKFKEVEEVYETKRIFIKVLSELFSETEKEFDEKNFCFIKKGIDSPILPENLSSGEKQILIILLTALLQHRSPCILLMDEPEISLHIIWQRNLIQNIKQINPNCQIIMVTHSSTTFYQGWIEKVKRIEDIQRTPSFTFKSKILEEKIKHSSHYIEEIENDFHNFSGSKLTKLYQFNRKINNYTSFTKEECIRLLEFLYRENEIHPDVITFTTLISKLNNYKDAKEIFDLIKSEEYTSLSHVKPNEITLNTLIKKVDNVQEGIDLIEEISSSNELQLYPDIITCSTLLGKAKNLEEIGRVEEIRNYYRIKENDIYRNKLNSRR